MLPHAWVGVRRRNSPRSDVVILWYCKEGRTIEGIGDPRGGPGPSDPVSDQSLLKEAHNTSHEQFIADKNKRQEQGKRSMDR